MRIWYALSVITIFHSIGVEAANFNYQRIVKDTTGRLGWKFEDFEKGLPIQRRSAKACGGSCSPACSPACTPGCCGADTTIPVEAIAMYTIDDAAPQMQLLSPPPVPAPPMPPPPPVIGPEGMPGMPGERGPQGVNGPVGPQGREGQAGTPGTPGVSGPVGIPGTSGIGQNSYCPPICFHWTQLVNYYKSSTVRCPPACSQVAGCCNPAAMQPIDVNLPAAPPLQLPIPYMPVPPVPPAASPAPAPAPPPPPPPPPPPLPAMPFQVPGDGPMPPEGLAFFQQNHAPPPLPPLPPPPPPLPPPPPPICLQSPCQLPPQQFLALTAPVLPMPVPMPNYQPMAATSPSCIGGSCVRHQQPEPVAPSAAYVSLQPSLGPPMNYAPSFVDLSGRSPESTPSKSLSGGRAPPPCPANCPRACYPACRPSCCNPPPPMHQSCHPTCAPACCMPGFERSSPPSPPVARPPPGCQPSCAPDCCLKKASQKDKRSNSQILRSGMPSEIEIAKWRKMKLL